LTAICLLLSALSLALLAQGAYYAPVQWAVGVSVTGAGVLTFASSPRRAWVTMPVTGCLLLGSWSLLRGIVGTDPHSGLRPALLALGLAAVFTLGRQLTADEHQLVSHALVLVGAVVALSGWAGVVWHVSPYGLANDGVWRAASTLTYANATAAVLGCLALATAGSLSGRPQQPLLSALLALLLTGAGATLSRAGLSALVAGTLLLLVLRGPGQLLRSCGSAVFGAAIALVGLLPSMPLTSTAGRPVAVVALAAGLAFAAWLPMRTQVSAGRVTPVALAVATAVALAVGPGALAGAADDVAGWRAHVSSPPRVEAARAGLAVFAERPWTGAGPGEGWTSWRGPDGSRATMRYVHDEYLQVAVDLGLPGLFVVLLVLVTAARMLGDSLRARTGIATAGLTAGACAALMTAAVHAGFDFVWHVPAVPLLVATVVGLGCNRGTGSATAGLEHEGVVA